MPPKKRTTRAAQPLPLPLPTESDTEALTDFAPPTAPPPKRTNTELNLTVLQRYNPSITHILSIAPFAVLYTFAHETQQWEKCGIEGTLFICQLGDMGNRFSVVILNRKGMENFELELVRAGDVEVTEEFVIVQVPKEDGRVEEGEGLPTFWGLWVFGDKDQSPSAKAVVAGMMQSCALRAEAAREDGDVEEEMEGPNRHAQADEQGYGMDGTLEMEKQMAEEAAVAEQAGQNLDLMQLFGNNPAVPQTQHAPEAVTSGPLPPAELLRPTRFTATADTDFFRNSASPATVAQQQQAPPSTQQNTVLGLLRG